MPTTQPSRRLPRPVAVALAIGLVAGLSAAACAKVEEPEAAPSREPRFTYVAVKLVPAGKTVRAAKADGSIVVDEVPGDIIGDDGIDDTNPIGCLVAGRAIAAGTVLRRSYFVAPEELGMEQGLTDGTTPDPEC